MNAFEFLLKLPDLFQNKEEPAPSPPLLDTFSAFCRDVTSQAENLLEGIKTTASTLETPQIEGRVTVEQFPELVQSSIEQNALKTEEGFLLSAAKVQAEGQLLFPQDLPRICTFRTLQIKGQGSASKELPPSDSEEKQAIIQETIQAQPEEKKGAVRYSITQGFEVSFLSVPIMQTLMNIHSDYRLSQTATAITMDLSQNKSYTAEYEYAICCKSMNPSENFGEPATSARDAHDFPISPRFKLVVQAHFAPEEASGNWGLKDLQVISVQRPLLDHAFARLRALF